MLVMHPVHCNVRISQPLIVKCDEAAFCTVVISGREVVDNVCGVIHLSDELIRVYDDSCF